MKKQIFVIPKLVSDAVIFNTEMNERYVNNESMMICQKKHETASKLLFHNNLQNLRSKFHKDVMFTWQQKTRGFLGTCSLKLPKH